MAKKTHKWLKVMSGLVFIALFGFLVLTSPWTWSLFYGKTDIANANQLSIELGQEVFIASNCSTCHATPNQEDPTRLGGGLEITSDFGTFYAPNISPDSEYGIGNWSLKEFTKAVKEGVDLHNNFMFDGRILYPSHPYTSYQHLTSEDVGHLYAYLKTVSLEKNEVPAHDLKFPFNIRRGVGVWRLLFVKNKQFVPVANKDDEWHRGRYLVEAAGHCAECHSARTFIGSIKENMRFAGAPDAENPYNYIPNITPDKTGIGNWTKNDIYRYLTYGVTPINQKVSGSMVGFVENSAQLSKNDRLSMAAYLKSLPGIHNPAPEKADFMTDQSTLTPLETNDLMIGEYVYPLKTKELYPEDGEVRTSSEAEGRVLVATPLKIVAIDNEKIQVEIDGWQEKISKAIVYSQPGKRIQQTILSEVIIDKVQQGEDWVESGDWVQSKLTGWVDTKDLTNDINALWEESRNLYVHKCSGCHTLYHEEDFSANRWIGTLKSMNDYVSYNNEEEYRQLLIYLQSHASDIED